MTYKIGFKLLLLRALIAIRQASYNLCRFFATDACHIKSQFLIMLMIFYSLDSINNILLLAWALVSTKNEY